MALFKSTSSPETNSFTGLSILPASVPGDWPYVTPEKVVRAMPPGSPDFSPHDAVIQNALRDAQAVIEGRLAVAFDIPNLRKTPCDQLSTMVSNVAVYFVLCKTHTGNYAELAVGSHRQLYASALARIRQVVEGTEWLLARDGLPILQRKDTQQPSAPGSTAALID